MENLDDGEFWLPPQFLTDDDILADFTKSNQNVNKKNREADSGFLFSNEYPWGFGPCYSDLSSPVESVVSSTETESDEEEFLAGLTRKMAHTTLLDDLLKSDYGLGHESQKTWSTAGSPQSTLSSFNVGHGCKEGSSRGSPNGPSLATSPPTAATLNPNDAAWKLLYAAAGEVMKMRMVNTNEANGGYYQKEGQFCPLLNASPVLNNPNPNPGFPAISKSLSYQQLQLAHFQQLKQQQMMKQQQGPAIWGHPETHQMVQNRGNTSVRPPGLSPSAWPTLHQSHQKQPQAGSGMRALFLGHNGSKRECPGTGVFLPRRIGSSTETRKKPAGCSTVLLPERVVQSLNLNLETMDSQTQPQHNKTFNPDYDAVLEYRNNVLMAQQKRNFRAQATAVRNQEIRLPSEWSY